MVSELLTGCQVETDQNEYEHTADQLTDTADRSVTRGRDDPQGTREKILDIALELFSTQGYDKTSLREIADELGFSKAAIYYHFESKKDILLALHLRLHDFGREALNALGASQVTPDSWGLLLDQLIEKMVEHRSLFILHERNQAALAELNHSENAEDHDDLQERFRLALKNPAIPIRGRVRMACAFGAVMGGLVLAGDVFKDVDSSELSSILRDAVRDLLVPENS